MLVLTLQRTHRYNYSLFNCFTTFQTRFNIKRPQHPRSTHYASQNLVVSIAAVALRSHARPARCENLQQLAE